MLILDADPLRPQVLDRGGNLGSLSNRTLGVLRSLRINLARFQTNTRSTEVWCLMSNPGLSPVEGFQMLERGACGGQLVDIMFIRMAPDSNVPYLKGQIHRTQLFSPALTGVRRSASIKRLPSGRTPRTPTSLASSR